MLVPYALREGACLRAACSIYGPRPSSTLGSKVSRSSEPRIALPLAASSPVALLPSAQERSSWRKWSALSLAHYAPCHTGPNAHAQDVTRSARSSVRPWRYSSRSPDTAPFIGDATRSLLRDLQATLTLQLDMKREMLADLEALLGWDDNNGNLGSDEGRLDVAESELDKVGRLPRRRSLLCLGMPRRYLTFRRAGRVLYDAIHSPHAQMWVCNTPQVICEAVADHDRLALEVRGALARVGELEQQHRTLATEALAAKRKKMSTEDAASAKVESAAQRAARNASGEAEKAAGRLAREQAKY